MEPEQPNDEHISGDNKPLLSLAQRFLFRKLLLTAWMNADKLEGTTDDIIADIVENRE